MSAADSLQDMLPVRSVKKYMEDSEEIEVVLADRKEVARIMKEERVALLCAYMMMHFLHDEEPFAFLHAKEK